MNLSHASRAAAPAIAGATPDVDGLIIKIVQRCNLACTYCYMYEHVDQSYLTKPAILTEDLLHLTIDRALEYLRARPGHKFAVTLHGGEPTMIGVKRFKRYVEILRERLDPHLSRVHVQTNGTLIDESWISLFRELKVAVGVSLDGTPAVHDSFRVDHFGRGSYDKVVRALEMLRAADIYATVLVVIDPAADGAAVYSHLRGLGVDHMDFLIPDVTHDTFGSWYPSADQRQLARFLISAFDVWFDEDDPNVTVRIFEDIIRMILGASSRTEAIGNPPINYLVIDTDGNIQGSDALRVCEPRMCDTGLNVRNDRFEDLARGAPHLYEAMMQGVALCETCRSCPKVAVCGGGNMPHRYARGNGFLNPSVWCEDLKIILDHIAAKTGHV